MKPIVIDNPFGTAYHESLYLFVTKSFFKIGSQDGPAPLDRRNHVYIHSEWSYDDAMSSGIIDKLYSLKEWKPFKDYELVRTTVNLSTPSDTNFSHTHENQLSVIYYVNLDWRPEWAGETILYNEDSTDIIYACMYKPARLLIFDGSTPHSIRPQSMDAPHYRLSLALFFNKK
jgi:hypothetical protein